MWLIAIWTTFWDGAAVNTKLESIELSFTSSGVPLPLDTTGGLQRHQFFAMARRLRESNATLQRLELPPSIFRDDDGLYDELVLPVLQLNRFRVAVDAIKREPDAAAREAARSDATGPTPTCC